MVAKMLTNHLVRVALAVFCVSGVVHAQEQTLRAVKIDEFGDGYQTSIIARLENLAAQLREQPNARGFIIVYRARRDLPGLSIRYALGMRDYVLRFVSEPERIIALDGGVAQELVQELWIVPPDTTPEIRKDAYNNDLTALTVTRKYDEQAVLNSSNEYDGTYYGLSNASQLDGFGGILRDMPKLRGYLIAYGAYKPSPLLRAKKNYLVKQFNLSAQRLTTLDGGRSKRPRIELWLVPPDDAPPMVRPAKSKRAASKPRRKKS